MQVLLEQKCLSLLGIHCSIGPLDQMPKMALTYNSLMAYVSSTPPYANAHQNSTE